MSDKTNYRGLLEDAANRGIAYREGSAARHVAPLPDAVENAGRFVEPLPERATGDNEVLSMLDELGSPATVTMVGPRYFGFVIGGSLPVTVATNWLTTAWDQNAGMHEVTPAASTVESVAMDWMADLFGLPPNCAALKSLGREGVAEMIERCCRNARRFGKGLKAAGFEILNDVVLNQVLVSFGDDARNREVIKDIQDEGTCWCGVTVWQGKTAMRISVCN